MRNQVEKRAPQKGLALILVGIPIGPSPSCDQWAAKVHNQVEQRAPQNGLALILLRGIPTSPEVKGYPGGRGPPPCHRGKTLPQAFCLKMIAYPNSDSDSDSWVRL